MESFVLIIVLIGSNATSIESVEFASNELCQAARSQYLDDVDKIIGAKQTTAFCAKTMEFEP